MTDWQPAASIDDEAASCAWHAPVAVDAATGVLHSLRMRSSSGLALLLIAACSGAPSVATPPAAPSTSASAPIAAPATELAPTPFTAEQIRDATKPGRTYRWKVEAAGKPVVIKQVTLAQVEPARVLITTMLEDEKGKVLESNPGAWSTWDALRKHAEFPKSAVTTRKESVTVPAGTFPCIVYVVKEEGGEITTYWFAESLPGAPVQFKTEKDGKEVLISRLLEHRSGI
ncbi:MAG: hypothetical protein HY898_31460 [Deltaproteobacteria bacterium]|nr:hypothetical protein [Deltaproteobacteria bacterium]